MDGFLYGTKVGYSRKLPSLPEGNRLFLYAPTWFREGLYRQTTGQAIGWIQVKPTMMFICTIKEKRAHVIRLVQLAFCYSYTSVHRSCTTRIVEWKRDIYRND
jgi:hypothetical protein